MSATASAALQQVEKIVAPMNFVSDAATLAGYEVDGLRPAAAARPASAEEAAEIVRLASAEHLAVIVCGGRSKLGIGAPPLRYDLALDLSRLDRFIAYDPDDLTLSVEVGIRVYDLQKILAAQRQFLPFAAPFSKRCTVGGVLAANSSGPVRQFYGSARDFTLGMEFIDGAGTRTRSGARVVKNVAGMDLHKLLIGSLGTLGAITSANFKTFPLPRATGTFVISYVRLIDALAMRAAIAASALAPLVIDIISPEAAPILDPGARHLPAARWSMAVVAGGEPRVVDRHGVDLERLASETRANHFAAIEESEKREVWEAIREFPATLLAANSRTMLWKLSVVPGNFAAIIAEADRIARENTVTGVSLIRSAGIIYLALLPAAGEREIIERLMRASEQLFLRSAAQGARCVIEWCPLELKQRLSVWGPPGEDFPLMQRVKKVFDPRYIFAPGRFLGGL
jgi:glycolate oxidase FAD binding subunit